MQARLVRYALILVGWVSPGLAVLGPACLQALTQGLALIGLIVVCASRRGVEAHVGILLR